MLPVLHQFGAYETPGCGYVIEGVLERVTLAVKFGSGGSPRTPEVFWARLRLWVFKGEGWVQDAHD